MSEGTYVVQSIQYSWCVNDNMVNIRDVIFLLIIPLSLFD